MSGVYVIVLRRSAMSFSHGATAVVVCFSLSLSLTFAHRLNAEPQRSRGLFGFGSSAIGVVDWPMSARWRLLRAPDWSRNV